MVYREDDTESVYSERSVSSTITECSVSSTTPEYSVLSTTTCAAVVDDGKELKELELGLEDPIMKSFVPLVTLLSCAKQKDNAFYIHGRISNKERHRVLTKAGSVEKFILCDSSGGPLVTESCLVQLAKLQDPSVPFFPSLRQFIIESIEKSSIASLPFFFTPELSTLEIKRIQESVDHEITNFLQTAAEVTPELNSLIIGPDIFSTNFISHIPQFYYLRRLKIVFSPNLSDPLSFSSLLGIGKLRCLTSFALECKDVKYSNHSFPGSRRRPWEVFNLQESPTLLSEINANTSHLFPVLESLEVEGIFELMADLISVTSSPKLSSISLHLLWPTFLPEQGRSRPEACFVCGNRLGIFFRCQDSMCSTTCLDTRRRNYLQHFFTMLEDLTGKSSQHISSLAIRLLNPPTDSHIFPLTHLMLCLGLKDLHHLTLDGWNYAPNAVQDALYAFKHRRLAHLSFSIDQKGAHISLETLRHLALHYPNLQFLQCRIEPLSGDDVPRYETPTDAALRHQLNILSVGSLSTTKRFKEAVLVARHLYLLFPELVRLSTHCDFNERGWRQIYELVKLCQTAHVDDESRSA